MDAAPLLYATIIVAAVVAIYLVMRPTHGAYDTHGTHGAHGTHSTHGKKSHFDGDMPPVLSQDIKSLRAGREKVLDAVRGNPDAAELRDALLTKYKLDQRQGASVRVEDIAEAERAAWDASHDSDGTAAYDPVAGATASGDALQYHAKGPAIDYDGYIAKLIMDDRTRDNHAKWVKEMRPWSGAIHNVDTFNAGNYLAWQGLRRPQAVTTVNPLYVTEVGPDELAENKKFNFM